METKRAIEAIAKRYIDGFDPKQDMKRDFVDLGVDSIDRFGFIADVEDVCDVTILGRLRDKLRSVYLVDIAVRNLKRVKKGKNTWVPCALDKERRCRYVSKAPDDSKYRSSVSPEFDFCQAVACVFCATEKQR